MEVLQNLFCFNIFIGDLTMDIETDLTAFLANGLGKKTSKYSEKQNCNFSLVTSTEVLKSLWNHSTEENTKCFKNESRGILQ